MRRYKIQLSTRCLPSPLIQITDEEENDVTECISEYMGPRKDFHNIKYTPSDLGYTVLNFYTSDGDTKSFSEKEIIDIYL